MRYALSTEAFAVTVRIMAILSTRYAFTVSDKEVYESNKFVYKSNTSLYLKATRFFFFKISLIAPLLRFENNKNIRLPYNSNFSSVSG